MFRYIISPANTTKSFVLGFSIVNDTITGFFGEQSIFANIPLLGRFFQSNFVSRNSGDHFQFCFLKYLEELSVTNNDLKVCTLSKNSPSDCKNISFKDAHNRAHSNEDREKYVAHAHLKYSKEITRDILKNFLKYLKTCEGTIKMPEGETFFTHEVRKDIIKKFLQYEKDQNMKMHTNNPCYEPPNTIPSIYQHAQYISESNASSYLPINSSNPECLQISESFHKEVSHNYLAVGCVALAGLVGISLFTKCLSKFATNEPSLPTAIPTTPAVSKGAKNL